MDFSKKSSIRHVSELIRHFWEFLPEDPDLHWHYPPHSQGNSLVELELDGKQIAFQPIFELKPNLHWLASLRQEHPLPLPLIVTPELSHRILNACKELNISTIDLNGRCWLRAPGLLVNRAPLPRRSFTYELEPRNIYVGKSARIVRCLLTNRARIWTQAEIVSRTGASSGLVSRITQHLISQGILEKLSPRELLLRDWRALLDDWATSDHFTRRTRTYHYAGLLSSPQDLAYTLQQWATDQKIDLAFTQWTAAWARIPFTEPPVCSAYIERLPDTPALESLGLRPVEDAGKLWLHVPDDRGILDETQDRRGLTLVTDAQIYVDLEGTGLRGPDTADFLKNFPGFCLP